MVRLSLLVRLGISDWQLVQENGWKIEIIESNSEIYLQNISPAKTLLITCERISIVNVLKQQIYSRIQLLNDIVL